MADITLTVQEDAPVALEYVEAKIKPEQIKNVTPGWEPVTVRPDAGYVLSQVNVSGMPEPTDTVTLTENDTYDVHRVGTAVVQVPQGVFPEGTLPITENGTGIDVTEYAAVDVDVPQGVFPSGTRTITENGTGIDVTEYAAVDVAVPVPIMPDEYSIGGSLYNKTLVRYHFPANSTGDNLKQWQFSACGDLEAFENFPDSATSIPFNFAYSCAKLNMESIPDGVTTIGQAAFSGCRTLSLSELPSTVTTIDNNAFNFCDSLRLARLPNGLTRIGTNAFQSCANVTFSDVPRGVTAIGAFTFQACVSITALRFLGDIASIGQSAFGGCSNCTVYDFRHCTKVPTLSNKNAFSGINSNAVIVVPDGLVTTWKAATNWITYADMIIGATDYDNS